MAPTATAIPGNIADGRPGGSQYQDEASGPEQHSTPRLFWVGEALDDQPTQANQFATLAEQPYSMTGFGSLEDRRLMSRVLYLAFSPSGQREHVQAVFDLFVESLTDLHPSVSAKYSVLCDQDRLPVEGGATALSSQLEAGERSTILLERDMLRMLRGGAVLASPGLACVAITNLLRGPKAHVEAQLDPIVQSFAEGFAGVRPSADTVKTATKIVQAAFQKASAREIEVDDTDGALSFELRVEQGLLVVGELSIAGNLHANVYNDLHPDAGAGIEEIWVRHLPEASAEDLIALF